MVGGKAFYGSSWLTRGDVVEQASGLSEIEGFAQYQISKNAFHVGTVKLALGAPSDSRPGVRPSLQSDGVDMELSRLYGRTLTFDPVSSFFAVEIGYRKPFSESAEQIRFLTTTGVEPSDRLAFLIDTYSVKPLGNERPGGADVDVVKIQPSAIWRLGRRFSLQAGPSGEVAGRNIDLGPTYFLGVWTQF